MTAADLPGDVTCQFRCDGVFVGPLPVFDLSTTGFAASAPAELALVPGAVLDSFELLLGDRPIWTGEASVVHSGAERLGGRFTSGVLDIDNLRLGMTLGGRLAVHREWRERLPDAWRAAVGDLRQLLEDVRSEVERVERSESHDPLRRVDDEARLFETLRAGWGREFYSAATRLHEMSKELDARSVTLGRSYASSMLLPLLMACPMHRRAFEKPLGYSGDYRMMELCYANELTGDGLYGRFLHSVTQNYTLVRTVRAREVVIREAVRRAIDTPGDGPVRILALAAGPAIELRHVLEQIESVNRPVHLLLLDQDQSAHEIAQKHLFRILFERHHGMLPVTVQCLHFSVRQLLRPLNDEEQRARELLVGLDLVYSAGLYDYLPDAVAVRLTQLLYGRLKPGGRLLVGNLVETPDSTWMMDYVCGWTLIYRTEEMMLGLARRLAPTPSKLGITSDATKRCVFLDVVRSSQE